MHRSAWALGLLVALAAATAFQGAPALGGHAATTKLPVIITEKGTFNPFPPHGRFVLGGPAGKDSGTSSIEPSESGRGFRDGQQYVTVTATDTLRSTKGALTIALAGTDVKVGETAVIEYRTWPIVPVGGTGSYASWRGGGRWAETDNGTGRGPYSLRLEGLVTP